jgi:hypothetical protein
VIPPEPIVVTKTVTRSPPANLIKLCKIGAYHGETNGDLLEWTAATISLLSSCNRDNYMTYQNWLESGE